MKNIFLFLFFCFLLFSCDTKYSSCKVNVGNLYEIKINESYEWKDESVYNPFFFDTIVILSKRQGWVKYTNFYHPSVGEKSLKWNYPIKKYEYCPEINFCQSEGRIRRVDYPIIKKKKKTYSIRNGVYFDERLSNEMPWKK